MEYPNMYSRITCAENGTKVVIDLTSMEIGIKTFSKGELHGLMICDKSDESKYLAIKLDKDQLEYAKLALAIS